MDAQRVNRVCGLGMVGLSLLAFLLVAGGAATMLLSGQPVFRQPDEGTAARIFQLSIVALVPTGVLFLATADWTRPMRAARPLVLSGIVVVLAFALLYDVEKLQP